MRNVAITMLALLVAASMPVDAAPLNPEYDECKNDVHTSTQQPHCVRVDYPAAPPSQASAKVGSRMFLWVDAVSCGPTCSVSPDSKNTLTGLNGRYALLYVDTNGLDGLQRSFRTVQGTTYLPDGLLLV